MAKPKRDNLDLLIAALEAFDPETFDPDAPENQVELSPEASERIWRNISAELKANGLIKDQPADTDPADVPVFVPGNGAVQ